MWIISRIKDEVTRKELFGQDSDKYDTKLFFCDEARAKQDLAWLIDHNGRTREYLLVAETTTTPKSVIDDALDDVIPW